MASGLAARSCDSGRTVGITTRRCADNESQLIVVISEEKQHRTRVGAKRTSVAIMLALLAVATKAHDALLQLALVNSDAAMATLIVFHGLDLTPLRSFELLFS